MEEGKHTGSLRGDQHGHNSYFANIKSFAHSIYPSRNPDQGLAQSRDPVTLIKQLLDDLSSNFREADIKVMATSPKN